MFTWSLVPRAAGYDIAITRDATDTSVIYDSAHEGYHSYLPSTPLEPGVRYHYWVDACNNQGCSDSISLH